VVKDIAAACDVVNDFATEHLQVIVADEAGALSESPRRGDILGKHTPVRLATTSPAQPRLRPAVRPGSSRL